MACKSEAVLLSNQHSQCLIRETNLKTEIWLREHKRPWILTDSFETDSVLIERNLCESGGFYRISSLPSSINLNLIPWQTVSKPTVGIEIRLQLPEFAHEILSVGDLELMSDSHLTGDSLHLFSASTFTVGYACPFNLPVEVITLLLKYVTSSKGRITYDKEELQLGNPEILRKQLLLIPGFSKTCNLAISLHDCDLVTFIDDSKMQSTLIIDF